MRILFIFLISCFVKWSVAETPEQALQIIHQQKVADEKQWHNLLHFKPTMFGAYESQIDSDNFFVDDDGKVSPASELDAFVRAIFSVALDGPEASALQCRFPARYAFLKDKVASKISRWPDRSCPKFDKWFETLRGTSLSLVFSSYYLNNPSSTFGHTLIRINKAPSARDGKRYELLDYGINYAANATTANPLLYTYMGLFGGFHGTFTTVPYYYKVREYNNAESRDLWEYELTMSQKSVDMFVAHMWEVGPTYADYWYLSENCSYHMLTLLEAADPNLDLTTTLKKYVIPTDTVQIAWKTPGLVKSFHFRPSVRTELNARIANLNENERNILSEIISNKKIGVAIEKLGEDRRRLVLDAAIDDMDYLFAIEVQRQETPQAQFKNQLLAARSRISQVTEPLQIEPSYREAPHNGHGSRRVGIGGFSRRQEGAGYSFNYRFAFHDIEDPVVGYPEYAQITFFDLHFNYFESLRRLDLENFMLFEVVSLAPYTRFSKSISWRLHVGTERLVNPDCMGCQAGQLSGGAGYAFEFSEAPLLIGYLGLKAGVYLASKWISGIGPNLTVKARWNDHWISLLEAWYRKDQNVSYDEFKEVSVSTQWSPNNVWGLRATGVNRWFESAGSLEFMYYY